MRFDRFSPKQRLCLRWWMDGRYRDRDAIICDGAVRSGKTLAMSLGFVLWAMATGDGRSFAICGRTITAVQRNVVRGLVGVLRDAGFGVREMVSKHYLDIEAYGHSCRFYLFGGKDEGSAPLIQGLTLGGVLFDEVVLMPRSFVEQAAARCSLDGAKLWFNCNPEHPYHWFYREWICKTEEKNALYLHFTMDDNPSLPAPVKERYRRMYGGVFYDRFVLGKWTASQGVVYPMFSAEKHVFSGDISCERYVISCDYGTVNPSSFGLWGLSGGVWYRLREYYYDSRREGSSRTDEEHYAALEELAGDRAVEKVIVDPSAASFIECIRRHGKFRVAKADNDVISGIRQVSTALKQGRLRFHESCRDIIREFSLYCWNERAGADAPVKENDHAMDDMRYFVADMVRSQGGGELIALSVAR